MEQFEMKSVGKLGKIQRFATEMLMSGRGDRDVSPDWNEAGKTKIPDLSVGKGCPYYFPTPFCQDLHPVRRSDCHKKPDDVLP